MMMDAGPKPVLMIESDNFGGKVRWCEARRGRLIVGENWEWISARSGAPQAVIKMDEKNGVKGNEKQTCDGAMNMAPEWVSENDMELRK